MVAFGQSDKIIKIIGKVNKSNTYNGFNVNISFLTDERHQTKHFCWLVSCFV